MSTAAVSLEEQLKDSIANENITQGGAEQGAIAAQENFYGRIKVTQAEVRRYFWPMVVEGQASKKYLWKSTWLLLGAKLMGIMAPFILKRLVDSMGFVAAGGAELALAGGGTVAAGVSGGGGLRFSSFAFWKAGLALMFWGVSRSLSSWL